MTIENLHLWEADRGTYFDRNINIITWSDEYKIKLGRYNSIGRECNFFLHANHRPDWVTTSTTLLGPVGHEIESMMFRMGHPSCKGDIVIENDVWIGATSTIMSGVTIHNGAIVGAGTTVTKDVPPYAIVVGNPGRIIKYRFSENQIKDLLDIKWWEWDEEKIRNNTLSLWSTGIDDFINKHRK